MARGGTSVDVPDSNLKVGLKSFGRLLIRPPVLLYFFLAATSVFWMNAAVYILLRTYLVFHSGIVAWMLAVAGSATLLLGIPIRTLIIARHPLLKAIKSCRQAGDLDGLRAAKEAWRAESSHATRPIFISLLSVFVVLPAACAIGIASSHVPMLVRDHGKLRYATHDEYLGRTLHYLVRHGWFTRFDEH